MYGKKVKLRVLFISLLLVSVIVSVFLILKSLEENVVYFLSPTEIKILEEIKNKKIRIGGMVKEDSITVNSKHEYLELKSGWNLGYLFFCSERLGKVRKT